MSDNIPAPILFWMLILFSVSGVFLGGFVGESKIKKQAIRAGVAYYTNDASGMAQFKWKAVKP